MQRIVLELRKVRYLQRIVVVLAKATPEQFDRARSFFQDLYINPQHGDGHGGSLSAGADGKGRSCWLAYGYLLAMRDCGMIALHDCDIVNYDRQLLARLCYAIAHPHLMTPRPQTRLILSRRYFHSLSYPTPRRFASLPVEGRECERFT